MPAAVLGHGSPMNALDDNRYTRAWRAFGEAVPTLRAILCVSAHDGSPTPSGAGVDPDQSNI